MTASPSLGLKEDLFYEGGPARGDLIVNLIFGATLIGLPFAIGAIVRAFWLRFKITSRRVSVSGGWFGRDRSQISYGQIKELRAVARGFGAWGDMCLLLKDGARLEMRALPRFREAEAFIKDRMAEAAAKTTTPAGFAVAAPNG